MCIPTELCKTNGVFDELVLNHVHRFAYRCACLCFLHQEVYERVMIIISMSVVISDGHNIEAMADVYDIQSFLELIRRLTERVIQV